MRLAPDRDQSIHQVANVSNRANVHDLLWRLKKKLWLILLKDASYNNPFLWKTEFFDKICHMLLPVITLDIVMRYLNKDVPW